MYHLSTDGIADAVQALIGGQGAQRHHPLRGLTGVSARARSTRDPAARSRAAKSQITIGGTYQDRQQGGDRGGVRSGQLDRAVPSSAQSGDAAERGDGGAACPMRWSGTRWGRARCRAP